MSLARSLLLPVFKPLARGLVKSGLYSRILKLFPTVSSLAPASTRPVQQGQVCEFDGVNDRIQNITDPLGENCTVSVWLKVDAIGVLQYVYDLRTSNSVNSGAGYLYIDTSGNLISENGNEGTVSAGVWTKTSVIHANSSTSAQIKIGARYNNVSPLGGKSSSFTATKTSTGELVRQYNLNHASGRTAYDSSGNGNHGTLQNGAAFVVDNTLPPEADKLNLEGYTDDSGVLKPRDESDPTNDIDGNPLQYSGSVYPRRPEYRNSYAASFDGIDDYVDCGNSTSFDLPNLINIQFYLKLNGTGLQNFISKGVGSTTNYSIDYSSGLRFFGYGSGSPVGSWQSGYTLSTGQWYHIQCIKDATHFRILVDGVEVRTVASTATLTTNSNSLHIGKRVNVYCDGSMSGVVIGDVAHYPLTEGAGNTAHDISGNGNHGTINNASTATEGAGFWAGRIDGEANALNNNNGFSKRMLFDGVDGFVDIFDNETVSSSFQSLSDDITIEANIFRTASGGYDPSNWRMAETVCELRQIGTASGTAIPFSFGINSNRISLGVTDDYTRGAEQSGFGSTTLSLFTPYSIKVVISGDNYEFFLNGVSDGSGTLTTATGDRSVGSNASSLTIGSRAKDNGVRDSNMATGIVWGVRVSTDSGGTVLASYNGYGNTDADWTDQSGNSNNGTVNGSPALLRIPADTSDPTLDVFGDTLTNPAITDGYNGAETELDAYNIAEGDNPSPATNNNPDLESIEFGADFASNDAAFMRLKSSTENDRLITFADDLTGDDKELVEKFTETP